MAYMKYQKIILALVLFAVCGPILKGYAEHSENLKGPAFSDVSRVLEMPDTWKRKSIVYESIAEGSNIVLNLDQQMHPALLPIINEYALKNKMKIATNSGSCGISAGALSDKKVDIGGLCCPPGITDRLPGLRFHTIGISSIAFIVHPDNPVENITLEEARKIFTGDIYRWSEIGSETGQRGGNSPIQPVGRLHCKLRAGHWRLLLDNEDLFSPDIIEVGAIPDVISQVSNNTRAIGYETLWMVKRFEEKGKVKVLKVNGYGPSDHRALLTGSYPLYRVYNLTTWEGKAVANPEAVKLVDYLMGRVEYLDDKYSLVPQSKLRQTGWVFKGKELVGTPALKTGK